MGAHIHGRYRLGARIEAAGFGEWWHAHDEEKDEAVRVAIVDARRAPAAAVTAFRDVSQKAARVRHPGLESIVHHGSPVSFT